MGWILGRPLAGLFLLWLMFSVIYEGYATKPEPPPGVMRSSLTHPGANAMVFSASQLVPFVFSAREATKKSAARLGFSDDTYKYPATISFLTMLQGLLSTILLFLIGLALRNRFRV